MLQNQAEPVWASKIIHTVYDCRFITAPQIARLFSLSEKVANDRLHHLSDSGYLAGLKRPVLDKDIPDTIYTLAQRGANFIASRLGVDRKLVRWRKYHNYVGLLFVEHWLAVNDVRIAFSVGAGMHGYTLEAWWYELHIREDVDDPVEKAPPLALRPDAYGVLLVRPRRIHFFLEVDRGTETHLRFAEKIRRYVAYKDARLFRHRFSGRGFRVLTVAPTVTRARTLRRVTEEQGGRSIFWFVALGEVTPERIAAPIWELAGGGSKAGLFDARLVTGSTE